MMDISILMDNARLVLVSWPVSKDVRLVISNLLTPILLSVLNAWTDKLELTHLMLCKIITLNPLQITVVLNVLPDVLPVPMASVKLVNGDSSSIKLIMFVMLVLPPFQTVLVVMMLLILVADA